MASGMGGMAARSGDSKWGMAKALGLCVLLSSSAMTVFGAIPDESAQTPAAMAAPGAIRNESRPPADPSTSAYVLLHKTWNRRLTAPTTAGLCACSNEPGRRLRLYAVSRRASESR
jgi:hypothetical protein